MARVEMKLKVNADELDRLAIGGRVYDKLNLKDSTNIFKITDKGLGVREDDIVEIIRLINTEAPNIEIIRKNKEGTNE